MRKWKSIIGVTLVFIAGLMTGAVGTKIYIKYKHPFYKRDPEAHKSFLIDRLTRELALNQDQKTHIEKIIHQMMDEVGKHRRKTRNEMRALFDNGFSKMKKILEPAQQQKLDEIRKKLAKRARSRSEKNLRR